MMLTFNNDNISKIIKFLNNQHEEEYLDRVMFLEHRQNHLTD